MREALGEVRIGNCHQQESCSIFRSVRNPAFARARRLFPLLSLGLARYPTQMNLRCLFGAHRPSLVSILKGKGGGWIALCEGCDARIEQNEERRWSLSEPLISKK